jgi:co-chaperonin GroES (HSP10)
MSWTIKPSVGNVLVKPLQEEEITDSGLILVTHIEKETYIAEVVNLCDPYEATSGDRSIQRGGPIYALGELVIIGKYNGRDIKIRQSPSQPHEKFIIIRESDILGILQEVQNGGNESAAIAADVSSAGE